MGVLAEGFFIILTRRPRQAEGGGGRLQVLKKLNNNTVLCRDGKGHDLVAFGTGIGFPPVPYELTDMKKVQRTFYHISPNYLAMMDCLPAEVVEFTSVIVDAARGLLPYELSPNLLLTLSDHIAFALERQRKGIYIPMPLADDLALMYPTEMGLARKVLRMIWNQFHVRLPENEASGIAMGIINARVYQSDSIECQDAMDEESIIDEITRIIETTMHLSIHRDSFNYARYVTHLRYLIKRLQAGEKIDSMNQDVYESVCREYADTASCVDQVCKYLKEQWFFDISDEERLYLILHVNRVCSNEGL